MTHLVLARFSQHCAFVEAVYFDFNSTEKNFPLIFLSFSFDSLDYPSEIFGKGLFTGLSSY